MNICNEAFRFRIVRQELACFFQFRKRTIQVAIDPIQTKAVCQMRFTQVWL